MTKSEKIAAIEHIIDRDKLAVKCRDQQLVYRRAYLMSQLRELGLPFKEVGRMLTRDHATAMYAIRMHDWMVSTRDKIYLEAIDDYVKELNGEIEMVVRQRDLQRDIMRVKTYSQVKTIQMRIKRGEYGNNVTM